MPDAPELYIVLALNSCKLAAGGSLLVRFHSADEDYVLALALNPASIQFFSPPSSAPPQLIFTADCHHFILDSFFLILLSSLIPSFALPCSKHASSHFLRPPASRLITQSIIVHYLAPSHSKQASIAATYIGPCSSPKSPSGYGHSSANISSS